LKSEDNACFQAHTGPKDDNPCKYGSLLFYHLRALLLYIDKHPERAFPKKRDKFRKTIYNKYNILIADNGYFNKKSLKAINKFYKQVPKYLHREGIQYDAPLFATQSVIDAWNCSDSKPSIGVSRRDFNVFHEQLGDASENGFPSDTPSPIAAADLLLVATRHEVAHQFDRVIFNREDSRMQDMKVMLTEASQGNDQNWLRSNVGDSYFQKAKAEIIASQIGNQYLHSTTTQLRLAVHRLENGGNGIPMSWFLFNVNLMTQPGKKKAPFYENESNGRVSKINVKIQRDSQGRINKLKIPTCGDVTVTYNGAGLVETVSDNASSCMIPS